jgi:hypothetical protein
MIIESMIAGITVIFVSSLGFANGQIKRQKKWDTDEAIRLRQWEANEDDRLRQWEVDEAKRLRDWEAEDNKEPEPEPVLDPFLEIKLGVPCPKCLRPAKNEIITKNSKGWSIACNPAEGPRLPTICRNPDCKAKKMMHLHGSCYTCGANWYMETADRTAAKNATKEEKKTCPQDIPPQ